MNVIALRMPIVCISVTVVLLIHLNGRKRLTTETAKSFLWLIVCLFANLITELVTEYTVNHRDIVPEAVNYIWHILFLISMLTYGFILYWYIVSYIEHGTGRQRRIEKSAIIGLWAVLAVLICVVPISYVDTPNGSYSLGAKADVLYVGVICAFVAMAIHLISHKQYVPQKQRRAIWGSLAIYIVIAVIQILFPYILLSGMAMTLMVLITFLALENPEKFVDERTGIFNGGGFERKLTEQMLIAKPMTVVAYAFRCELGSADSTIDDVMRAASSHMAKKFQMTGYRLTDNIIVFMNDGKRKNALAECGVLPGFDAKYPSVHEQSMRIEYPWDCANYDEIMDVLEEFRMKNTTEQIFTDVMTGVYNRNRYEHDKRFFIDEKEHLWYILVDINNLKIMNDTKGHAVGDELIKSVAQLLKKTFAGSGYVYRTGGDEFAVIYLGDMGIDEIKDRLKKACEQENADRTVKLDFALGFAEYRAGQSDWIDVVNLADKNMYEDKAKRKKTEFV